MSESNDTIEMPIERSVPQGWDAENWTRVLDTIESSKCIPIIGRALSRIVYNGEEASSDLYQSFLRYSNALSDTDTDADTLDELFFMKTQNHTNTIMFNQDFTVYTKKSTEIKIDSSPIEDLLKGWDFPAVINLCPSGACQQALTKLGIPFRQVNISPTEGIQSFTEQAADSRIPLINVFGTVLGKSGNFALATHQQLTFLLKLVNDNTANYLPENPKKYQFLGVGCQTPDWLGRILIHWLSNGESVSEVRLSSVDTKTDIDTTFEEYATLGGQGFKFVRSDPLDFCARFSEFIDDVERDRPEEEINPEQQQEGLGTFFSFVGDPDRDTVLDVHNRIKELPVQPGFVLPPLFIDKDLKPGAQGMSAILRKLELCKRFVIFTSWKSMFGISRGNESDAFLEWKEINRKLDRMGDKNNRLFVVFIYDEDPEREHSAFLQLLLSEFGDYHEYYDRFFLSKTAPPQIVFVPRDVEREQARDGACRELAAALVSEGDK